MSNRQVMQQALETLEGWDNYGAWVWPESALEQSKRNTTDSIAALREALAQPVQEPVAWRFKDPKDGHWLYTTHVVDLSKKYWRLKNEVFEPLYTTPPAAQRPWQGLTQEEIWKGLTDADWSNIMDRRDTSLDTFQQGVVWAQARLKERNHG